MKNARPNQQIVYEHRPSEAWISSGGPLTIKQTAQSVGLMESYFFAPRLTGSVYRAFLRNVLPELSEDVDLQTRIYLSSCMTVLYQILFLQFGNS